MKTTCGRCHICAASVSAVRYQSLQSRRPSQALASAARHNGRSIMQLQSLALSSASSVGCASVGRRPDLAAQHAMHASRQVSARAGRAADRVQLGDSDLQVSGELRLTMVSNVRSILKVSESEQDGSACMHCAFCSASGRGLRKKLAYFIQRECHATLVFFISSLLLSGPLWQWCIDTYGIDYRSNPINIISIRRYWQHQKKA